MIPSAALRELPAKTFQMMPARVAPMAERIPISRVRWLTSVEQSKPAAVDRGRHEITITSTLSTSQRLRQALKLAVWAAC